MRHATTESNRVDSNYFRTTDVEPDILGDEAGAFVQFYEGRGGRRRQSGSDTHVIVDAHDFLATLTGFWHKHGGGQFYRYFVQDSDGQITRKIWNGLTIEQQQAVLDADRPTWAKSPGMLSTKRAKPLSRVEKQNCIGYKDLVIRRDENGGIVSVTSPSRHTAWEWDDSGWVCRAHKTPEESNKAGVYITFKAPVARAYSGELCKVMLSGVIVRGETGARGEFARLLEVIGG